MKRTAVKILCVCMVLMNIIGPLSAQDRKVRIGFQTSPVFSTVRTNENLILKNGGNFGLKLGATGDIHFKENYSFTLGLNLAFHEGGEFLYEIGGNLFPNSELSDELLQTGDKPLPDGVMVRYKLQYLEFPVGFKIRTEQKGYFTYFLEAPVFTFSFLTRGRADIETEDYIYEGENVYKDLAVANVFWGFGGGVEYALSANTALVGGIYYQKGMFDFTRDNGHLAIENPDEDPNVPNDDYFKTDENSRATVRNIVLRLGIIF
jgi:Outer membrane protein beta-barrel domain